MSRTDGMDVETLAMLAGQIVDNPVWDEAIEILRAEAYDNFENSKLKDTEAREAAYHELQALNRIQTRLKGHLDNLKMLKAGKLRRKSR